MNTDFVISPLVSIITPTFNSEQFIEETILSIKAETYPHFEHIVVDGGSTDGTLDIIRKYKDIKWISEPDNGMYDAINKGFRMAQGEILTYINSDDLYYSKDTIRLVVSQFVKDHSIDFIFGHCAFIDVNGKCCYIYKAPHFNRKIATVYKRTIFQQPTCFWRKRVHIGFDISLKYCGDAKFFRYLCENHKGKNIGCIIAKFRVREDSFSVTRLREMREEDRRIFGDVKQKVPLFFKLFDLIYIRTILNLRANIKRLIMHLQKRPYL